MTSITSDVGVKFVIMGIPAITGVVIVKVPFLAEAVPTVPDKLLICILLIFIALFAPGAPTTLKLSITTEPLPFIGISVPLPLKTMDILPFAGLKLENPRQKSNPLFAHDPWSNL